jgi:hypothetical protein
MSQEITTKTKCILTREGIEIWITPDEVETISLIMQKAPDSKMIDVGDETIRVDRIVGIYSADKIYEQRKRTAGMWQCEFCKRWHPKFEECGCQGGRF